MPKPPPPRPGCARSGEHRDGNRQHAPGDGLTGRRDWVQDGESDAEYLRSIQRDTIARLDATARDIEALLTEP